MRFKGIIMKLLIIITFVILIFLANTVHASEDATIKDDIIEVVSYDAKTQTETIETYNNNTYLYRGNYNSVIPNHEPKVKNRAIIDGDDREGMLGISKYPYSAVCLLISYFPSGTIFTGSGAVIGEDKVLTSAHNIYNYDKKEWATTVRVIPAAFGGTVDQTIPIKPYSSTNSEYFWAGSTYVSKKDVDGDWGVLKLDYAIGNDTGWYGLQGYGDASMLTNKLAVSRGYPKLNNHDRIYFEMFEAPGRILDVYPRRFYTDIDVEEGQSGSPVCLSTNDSFIVGIIIGELNASKNVAVRLSNGLVDTIRDLLSQ